MLELASERVFVPLTVGGGIRSYTDDDGKVRSSIGNRENIISLRFLEKIRTFYFTSSQENTNGTCD